MAKDKNTIRLNNVMRVTAAHDIKTKKHIDDMIAQNELFTKEYDKKMKQLKQIDSKQYPKEYLRLSNEITDMAVAIKMNENTIKELQLT